MPSLLAHTLQVPQLILQENQLLIQRENKNFQVGSNFPGEGVLMLIPIETYISSDFPGGLDPLPSQLHPTPLGPPMKTETSLTRYILVHVFSSPEPLAHGELL